MSEKSKKIFAFDIGTGSLAPTVRVSDSADFVRFQDVHSLLLPAEYADTKPLRTTRRAKRTRDAHKARECWLRHFFRINDLRVLKPRNYRFTPNPTWGHDIVWDSSSPADPELEREFPKKGDDTVYCGALLRTMLLQGKPLQEWQVFKAFHSAIQKRGYDPKLPWANNPGKNGGREDDEEAGATKKALDDTQKVLSKLPEGYRHPSYWEACQMGLWNPDEPSAFLNRQNHHALATTEQVLLSIGEEFLALTPAHISIDGAKREEHENFLQKMEAERRDLNEALEDTEDKDERKNLEDKLVDIREYSVKAIFLRETIENELRALYVQAEKQYPALRGKCQQLLYGLAEAPYASYENRNEQGWQKAMQEQHNLRFVEGKKTDWQGVLSQKIPTFENRNPEDCRLFPKFRVASIAPRCRKREIVPDSLLPSEVTFLMKLKNFRYLDAGNKERGFTPPEIQEILETTKNKAQKAFEKTLASIPRTATYEERQKILKAALTKYVEHLKLTTTNIENCLKRLSPGYQFLPEQNKIAKPKASGRARYSRPALALLKALILSGLPPEDFREKLLTASEEPFPTLRKKINLNTGNDFQHTEADLAFLSAARMGETWQKLYLPNEALEKFSRSAREDAQKAREERILELIGKQNDPIVRHRLTFYYNNLKKMTEGKEPYTQAYGEPDYVVIEFAREQWMEKGQGKEAKERRKKKSDFDEKQQALRVKAVEALGRDRGKQVQKYTLASEQKWQCPFCLRHICQPGVHHDHNAEIPFERTHRAHIVPESQGGPGNNLNLLLTCEQCNLNQQKQYHADWLTKEQFQKLTAWLESDSISGKNGMPKFKRKLLATPDLEKAKEMVEKRTALTQTAWIEKLTRTITCLYYGWALDSKGETRKVITVNGGLTNAVAKKYQLYRLLGAPDRIPKLQAEIEELRQNALALHRENPEDPKTKKAWLTYYQKRDSLDDKFRDDKRHHALDSMILSFIPHWAGDPNKAHLFELPESITGEWQDLKNRAIEELAPTGQLEPLSPDARNTLIAQNAKQYQIQNAQNFFRPYLEELTPLNVIHSKPTLEEKIYGKYTDEKGKDYATINKPLSEIAYTGLNPKYSFKTLKRNIAKLLSHDLREHLHRWSSKKERTEEEWKNLLKNLTLSNGTQPKRAKIRVDSLEEYADLSQGKKDGTGFWRKGDKHQGYFIYLDKKSRAKVEPVYVHSSKKKISNKIKENGFQVVGFFQSGCKISLQREFQQGAIQFPPGKYTLNTVSKAGQVKLTSDKGKIAAGLTLTHLVNCGMQRID